MEIALARLYNSPTTNVIGVDNMTVSNQTVADIFDQCAKMLQIKGESVHRWMAYSRVAEAIRDLPRDLSAMAQDRTLHDIPGVGKVLAEKIEELLNTGQLAFHQELQKEVPLGVVEMTEIHGVGPKKATLFWKQLNITTVAQLEQAALEGRLATLEGMGKKSEQKILESIQSQKKHRDRTPLGVALPIAKNILAYVLELDEALHGEIAGSIRRGRPTIGDVDLLVAGTDPEKIMQRFVSHGEVEHINGQGKTKSSVVLRNGLQVDLWVLEPSRFGTALQYASGSQMHNIRIREIALKAGYSLNEHALTPINAAGELLSEQEILCATEKEVYAHIGLPWIAPELREDNGEIEAAKAQQLPHLVELQHIRADLHMHTTWSDGSKTIREMAEAARARGLEYICITDHSITSRVANGLGIDRLLQQREEVQRVNAAMGDGFTILHGTEMDIQLNGTLDYPDDILEQLDFVIASLHFGLSQDRATITKRLLNAINNPHVDMIAHMRGQLIMSREPADLDMDQVFAAAQKTGIAFEINSNPKRLDLEAQYARRAVEMGIPISINTDSHRIEQLANLDYGIRTARRGWVPSERVINTWSPERFREWVGKRGKA